ncbi:hypothetical protein Mcup_1122 [Metallosphaera cuprina Ar-4]|uniref:Uncharacterized protein n=1 Tax=Metallosphaera cuprina (strain Ar-4) TaxID=1006006 RepID=F4G329_METCR|nr:hypothetical protein Mcup_1122 [Metallosphaera cuprina Ar-4]
MELKVEEGFELPLVEAAAVESFMELKVKICRVSESSSTV